MRRALWVMALAAGCFGGAPVDPQSPPVGAAPASPAATARVADASLSVADSAEPLPADLLRIDLAADGLWITMPGGERELVTPVEGEGTALTPVGMKKYGEGLTPLVDWIMTHLKPSTAPKVIAVSVPADARYEVVKPIFREFHVAGARTAWLVVRRDDGSEGGLPMPYPELLLDPSQQVPTLRLLLSPEGATYEGLGDAAIADRRTYDCDPPCTTPDTWPRRDLGRMALRAHKSQGLTHLAIIPHNDVRWDVIIDLMDLTRTDARLDGQGAPMFSDQRIAGARRLEPTPEEQLKTAVILGKRREERKKQEEGGGE